MSSSESTTVGNYFISNYPPFSFWTPENAGEVRRVLDGPPADKPLGLYLHLPFCRKRCDFCYFKVYTDKNGREVKRYLDAVLAELELYLQHEVLAGRHPSFVYFGGGTPSYLSSEQLDRLFEGLQERLPWIGTREVAFECEPGTLQEHKLERLHRLGVTRLSLGLENFDAEILELNNRAHREEEIDRAYGWARGVGFEQINLDLIAGMVGETDANWERCIQRTLELDPESVTVYQMEVPFNTTIYRRMKDGSEEVAPVADWETKRRWTEQLFTALGERGYRRGSAYTAYKPGIEFLYRDALWQGADMLGLGVSSFGHVSGVHYQNEASFDPYIERVERGELPIRRAHQLDEEELLIREFVLQLKLGRIQRSYFQEKFGVDVTRRFAEPLARNEDSFLVDDQHVTVTKAGLLVLDRLLWDFFKPEHRGSRYS